MSDPAALHGHDILFPPLPYDMKRRRRRGVA